MSKAEEQRARRLARNETAREAAAQLRSRIIDRAVEDLPEFGITLTREEIEAWLTYAEKLRALEAKEWDIGDVHHARLWDEGWVLAIAMLYRSNPDQDLTKRPKLSFAGPSFIRVANRRKSSLYLAYYYAAERMGATMTIEDERVEQNNLEEAFPRLDAFVEDEWDLDRLRFDDDTMYQIPHDDYDTIKRMIATLSGLCEALKEKAWREEVTSMCNQLGESWQTIGTDLARLSIYCDDPDDGMFVAGVYLNGLDHYFSLEQGHFAYTMQILNLLRGQLVDVRSLTGSLVGAFTVMRDLISPFADDNYETVDV